MNKSSRARLGDQAQPCPSRRTVRTGLVHGSCLLLSPIQREKRSFVLRSVHLPFSRSRSTLQQVSKGFYPIQRQYASSTPPTPKEQFASSPLVPEFAKDHLPAFRRLTSSKPLPLSRRNFQVNFTPSHPTDAFGHRPSPRINRRSSQFYPPHRCRASRAGTSSLLRAHLPPCTLRPAP